MNQLRTVSDVAQAGPFQPPGGSYEPSQASLAEAGPDDEPNDKPSEVTLRLNEFFLCRVAAMAEAELCDLVTPEYLPLFEQYHAQRARVAAGRDRVSQLLFTEIGRLQGRDRSRALALRRRLFQDRQVADADVAGMTGWLDSETCSAIESTREAIAALEQTRFAIHAEFEWSLVLKRARVSELLKNDSLRRGILLSSGALHAALVALASGTRRLESSRGQRTVRGLLLYATRMALKTSPFGTLCSVIPGRVDRTAVEVRDARPIRFDGALRSQRGHVRLNKSLYAMITASLRTEGIGRRRMPLRLNSSLVRDNGHYAFVATVAGKECIQRLPRDGVSVVADLLEGETATLEALEARLVADAAIDASASDIGAYLAKLVEYGLLVPTLEGVREEEWSLPLINWLASVDEGEAQRLASLLSDVEGLRRAYSTAGLDDRAGVLAEARKRIADRSWPLEYGAQLKMNLAFYEDATSETRATLHEHGLQAALYSLRQYLNLTIPLSWSRTQHVTMRLFFEEKYGAGTRVPLIRFYEDYARYRKQFEEEQSASPPAAPVPPLVEALSEARRRLSARIREMWRRDPQAEELHLTLRDLEDATREVHEPIKDGTSITVFCQVDKNGPGRWRLVVPDGRWQAGFGKYFSRFLHMFPDDAVELLRASNRTLGGAALAEIGDDAAFNANLHPPLTDHEIVYPTSAPRRDVGGIAASDLWVECPAHEASSLVLYDAVTGRAVQPVDLGFMSEKLRPPLYQLLTLFCPARGFAVPLPGGPGETLEELALQTNVRPPQRPAFSPSAEATPRITYRPRVICDGHLVIGRRQWMIAPGETPLRDQNESLSTYAMRLADWRQQHGIPDEAFVRVHSLPTGAAADVAHEEGPAVSEGEESGESGVDGQPPSAADGAERQSDGSVAVGDDRKPQYVRFSSPMLVDLFSRLAKRHSARVMVIEERLPSSTGLVAADDGEYVTELVLQFDSTRNFTVRGRTPDHA